MQNLITLNNLHKLPNGRIIAITLSMAIGLGVVYLLGSSTLFMLAILLTLLSIFEGNKACNSKDIECDDIMLDSFVGGFFALVFAISSKDITTNTQLITASIIALIAYILMDKYKPSTIKWLKENVKGALGITLSSILAGIAGGFVSILVMYIT